MTRRSSATFCGPGPAESFTAAGGPCQRPPLESTPAPPPQLSEAIVLVLLRHLAAEYGGDAAFSGQDLLRKTGARFSASKPACAPTRRHTARIDPTAHSKTHQMKLFPSLSRADRSALPRGLLPDFRRNPPPDDAPRGGGANHEGGDRGLCGGRGGLRRAANDTKGGAEEKRLPAASVRLCTHFWQCNRTARNVRTKLQLATFGTAPQVNPAACMTKRSYIEAVLAGARGAHQGFPAACH